MSSVIAKELPSMWSIMTEYIGERYGVLENDYPQCFLEAVVSHIAYNYLADESAWLREIDEFDLKTSMVVYLDYWASFQRKKTIMDPVTEFKPVIIQYFSNKYTSV